MAEKEKDYFENVKAMPLGKRKLSRLNTKRILQRIAQRRSGWDQGWTAGKISFMKTYPVKMFPRTFANPGDDVKIQVSIRLVLGKTAKEAPVSGLKGLEVYYRFLRTIVIIPEKETKESALEEEQDEQTEFSTGRSITEETEWVGSYLSNSSMAKLFYKMLSAIGVDKLNRLVKRVKDKK